MIQGMTYDPEYDALLKDNYYLQDYEKFCKLFVQDLAKKYGGVSELSKVIHVDTGNLSKVISGKYIPEPRTMMKWFPGLKIDMVPIAKIDQGNWY